MKLTQVKKEIVLNFEDWARAKFDEINANINPCDENGGLDPVRLNNVLTSFSSHFAWAITIQEVESNKLSIISHEYDKWYKSNYNEATRVIRQENSTTRVPSQASIEARMVDLCGEEMYEKQKSVEDVKSRVNLLKGFVKVLERQASILQTLSSNMRSELFFSDNLSVSDGVVSRRMDELDKNEATKSLLRGALVNQQE